MAKHQPQVDWARHEILEWDPSCSSRCLKQAHAPVVTPQQEESPNLAKVPREYHNLGGVFFKSRVMTLPPHRPYDCAIELQPGAIPPRGLIFSLSRLERAAMVRYLTESLAAGIIHPSSSPAGACFFFVGKKDSTLRPCINYRGTNAMTVHNRNPLPHRLRANLGGHHLHEVRPTQRIPSGEDQGGQRVEDGLQTHNWTLGVPSDAVRAHQRAGRLPDPGERHPGRHVKQVCVCLP